MNIMTKVKNSYQYIVSITNSIGEIHEYAEFVKVLASAAEHDEIYIRLSSPGGSLETCDYLCRRMEECEAHITVEIGSTCAFTASAIALKADDWVIYDSSSMIIHSTSYSLGHGKESDIRSTMEYMERVNREWIERTYSGFLREDEMYDALAYGTEIYLCADDLRERMPLFQEHRKRCKARQIEEIMRQWDQQKVA